MQMSEHSGVQEHLFEQVKNRLAPNLSFVHELSELLGISYDSTYRRIRGQKDLSLEELKLICTHYSICLLYTSPSPRDRTRSRMPSSA